jgi:hypothetical protein
MSEFEKHKEESLVEEVDMSVPSTVVIKKSVIQRPQSNKTKCCK